jgi:hypothetical protein
MMYNTDEQIIQELVSPFISIIVPLKTEINEHQWNRLKIDKIRKKTLNQINQSFDKDIALKLETNFEQLISQIKPNYKVKGLGLYFSPESYRIVEFPFEVKEKFIIDDHFNLKDIYYLSSSTLNYLLLELNFGEIKLFEGYSNQLREIKDKVFPIKIVDDREYAKPSIARSYGYGMQTTEDDAERIRLKHLMNYIDIADDQLNFYLLQNEVLFIAGEKKETALFTKHSSHSNKISSLIASNYIHQPLHEKVILLKEIIANYILQEENKLLKRLEDAIGKKLAVTGIQQVWNAAKEGKGLILMIEKDFEIKGFEVDEEQHLYLNVPDKNYNLVADAAEDCISTVLSKGGKVVVFDNNQLLNYNRVAMILRFK